MISGGNDGLVTWPIFTHQKLVFDDISKHGRCLQYLTLFVQGIYQIHIQDSQNQLRWRALQQYVTSESR